MKESNCYHIASAGSHQVKTGRGRLESIVINTTANGSITVYDGTDNTGRVIAILKASIAEQDLCFHGTIFLNGLFVVTAGASDISVLYN